MSLDTSSQESLKIFFFGAPYFSREILSNLLKHNVAIDCVITHPDQPVGRKKILTPTPIKVLSLEKNIPVKEFYKLDNTALDFFQKEKPDLFITASYGSIIPQEILDIPRLGALNVHPSLLPKLRGATPIQTALLQGYPKTGTTIMLMDAGMDTGDILEQVSTGIKPTEKYPELESRLIDLSNKILHPVVKKIIKQNSLPKGVAQVNSQATFTKLISKKDGLIDWEKSAQEIYNQWRAFYSWPQIYTFYNNQKLTLTEISLISLKNKFNKTTPGTVVSNFDKSILVKTGGGFIKINKLQLAGKKEMSISDFLNGQQKFLNSNLS